uniref:FTH domain-containing protein n=1 Tax=Caenorhabditis tropicalis TaxID=1561998 RepID=A0A1I7U511_9PELO
MKPKPPPKKKIPQKNVRRAAKIGLLKCIFAELYTPSQIASIKFDAKVDYGMDREIVDFMAKLNRKFMRLERPPLDFEIFKLCLLYILTPDIRRIVGDIEILDFDNHHCLEISKIEKIRREIYDYKNRPRHPAELHVGNLLDFIFKKIEPNYKYTEIIYFSVDSCNLESVLDEMCDAAPKKEHFTGHPGKMDHVVFVKQLDWPDRSYVLSPDIYKMYPELKGLLSTADGMAFYQNYMNYIAVSL